MNVTTNTATAMDIVALSDINNVTTTIVAPVAKAKAAPALPKLVTQPKVKPTAVKAEKTEKIAKTPQAKVNVEAPAYVNLSMKEVHVLTDWNARGIITEESVKALAGAIKEQGLLHPITVQTSGVNCYHIVAGHRRFAAAGLLKWTTIPCRIVDAKDALIVMALENLSREDLKAHEEIGAYGRLADTGMSAREISRRTGVSNVLVSERLSIGVYPELVTAMSNDDRPLAVKRAAGMAQKGKTAKLTTIPAEWIATEIADQYDALDKAVEKRAASLAAKKAKADKVDGGEGEGDGGNLNIPNAKTKVEKVEPVDMDDVAQYLAIASEAAEACVADGSPREAFIQGIRYALLMIQRQDTAKMPFIKMNPEFDTIL
jgi:ParB/RepB/Spo0J family partition protein